MRCHRRIFPSVNVACYVYMWWWVGWRVFSFSFPPLNVCSTNTISKSFRYLRSWWSKNRNWEPTTESDNEACVYREHNGANHELFGIFFSFQPLTVDWVVIDCSRRWWDIIIIITISRKKSDQIMCLNLMLLCS